LRYDDANVNPWIGGQQPRGPVARDTAPPAPKQKPHGGKGQPITYPEVYYIVMPFVMMECDRIEIDDVAPTEDMMDEMCGRVYDRVCGLHPDFADAHDQQAVTASAPAMGMPHRRGYPPRRQGVSVRDIIRILLLQELMRRRRRPY
jgi:hypothetical protein